MKPFVPYCNSGADDNDFANHDDDADTDGNGDDDDADDDEGNYDGYCKKEYV